MDHFENLIATLLEAEGYWVRQSFKVNLTTAEKRRIGKPSIPRPEIDLLALDFKRNEVLALEAKSYLDSPGVKLADLEARHKVPEGRYKLFTCARYRAVVTKRLHADLIAAGMARPTTRIRFGLAAGRVYRRDANGIRQHMESHGWHYWSPDDVRTRVTAQAERGYENDPAIITAKILVR